MVYTSPSVVIDNGSYTTKAGFANEDIPSLVFNTNYVEVGDKVVVGDDNINENCQGEVMTIMDNGVIYNFDRVVDNWNYVFDNVDNGCPIESKEYPLVLTEQPWNSVKNKLTTSQIVFEQLEVPIFSLVKTPLAQLYHAGKATGLVIDVGSSVCSVTPILDGIIQTKSSFHSRFAGDFLNLHVVNYLTAKTAVENLLPQKYATCSESFRNYYISHNILQEYKNLSLNYQLKDLQLPQHNHINVADSRNYLENLFQPQYNKLPGVEIPPPSIDKPHTHGLTNLVFLSLKSLEASLLPSSNDQNSAAAVNNKFARFNEIFKTLFANIMITGGTSLANGLVEQIVNDIRALTPQYFPNYGFNPYAITTISSSLNDINDVWERQFSAWLGATNLAAMLNDRGDDSNSVNIAMDNWFVTKADYEELGEDLIVEKFK
jgi:actin-related protein 7